MKQTRQRNQKGVSEMQQYLQLCKDVITNGTERNDRTGTGTLAVFGRQLRFNLQDGFPLVTTKKMHTRSIFHELIWMISGSLHIGYLQDNNVHIWDAWTKNGFVGPMYGYQWRNWQGIDGEGQQVEVDQLNGVIDSIQNDPFSRRHLISAWNVAELPLMALPPCHFAFQFYVENGTLSCMVSMRSVDVFLGLPFDIASYATLTHMVAHITGLRAGELIFSLGDTHIYNNHINQVLIQLCRDPLPLPIITVNKNNRLMRSIDSFTFDDIDLIGYQSHSELKGAISV